MRILIVTSKQPIERKLAQLLERKGHQITRLCAGGEDLLSILEQGALFHAAVLNQVVLGQRWPRQVRQLRRRAPHLPAILLLAPGAEHTWRHAILAGAFEAVPLQSSMDVVLDALFRALNYSAGKLPQARPRSHYVVGTFAPASRPDPTAPVPVGASRG